MKNAEFRFYEELNDFLPEEKRKVHFPWTFLGRASVKFAIEAMGVPHTEVDLILVNGRSVDFTYNMQDGDSVSVYPVFERLDTSPVIRLREEPLRDPKFITDAHLGKLTKYLRLCGFDTAFGNSLMDSEIIEIAGNEKRTILTRDKDLLKSRRVTRGYWVREQFPREQIREIIHRFDLRKKIRAFTRCMECNHLIIKVSKENVQSLLWPKTLEFYQDFWKCDGCGRLYWQGSHWVKMAEFIRNIM